MQSESDKDLLSLRDATDWVSGKQRPPSPSGPPVDRYSEIMPFMCYRWKPLTSGRSSMRDRIPRLTHTRAHPSGPEEEE